MNEGMDLRQYLALGKKWWWLIIICLSIGAVIGFATTPQAVPSYQATTTLVVGTSIQTTNFDTTDLRNSVQLAKTYANMAQRQPVIQGVIDTLHLKQNWKALANQLTIVNVPETQLLEITATSTSAAEAKAIADEIANQLIALSPSAIQEKKDTESRQFVQQRLADLQSKIEAGQERLNTLEATMQGSLSADEIQELQTEITNLEKLISDWENTYTQLFIFLETDKAPNNLALFESAQVNTGSTAASPSRNALLGGFLGLIVSLGIIFLVEYMDDTIKATPDITNTLELTSLGRVDKIDGKLPYDRLLVGQDPFSPISEEYRIIRSNLQFMSVDYPLKSILITSPSPAEGKSITAANLGIVMAQAGFKTVIVDTDLRRPVQHKLFQLADAAGLTDLLRSSATNIDPYLNPTPINNLYVMTSGTIPPNPSELLGSQRMADFVEALRDMADIVIYDSPPVLAVADALVLSNQVDGVAVVVQAKKTRLESARQALMTLHQGGAYIIGGILNRSKEKSAGYYQYYHHGSTNGHVPAHSPIPAEPQRHRQKSPF
ncbi:MAG: polysaccharide biosynthesis tyrosine autokinase [Anaerolineae bacterium]|nr:polysaccharide biosynthesis tyrosine autokinase [Anaerolineae bacterium]